jgi:hypothetical protein
MVYQAEDCMSDDTTKVKMDPLGHLRPVNLWEAEQIVEENMKIGWTSNLMSSPGIGKSSVVQQIADRWELLLIDLRLSSMIPEDTNGLPNFFEKNGVMRAKYIPMDFWPLDVDELPINPLTGEPYKGFLLFLDEYNSGSLMMQAASYQIILDKRVGQNKLHPKCYVVCAGNLMSDRAITNELGTATQSRLWHIPVKVCHETWLFWANSNGIDERVKAFVNWKPELLHSFNPDHNDLTFPCPRTWEGISKRIGLWNAGPLDHDKVTPLAGVIGVGAAKEFVNFTQVYRSMVTLQDIIKNPKTTPVPLDPSVQNAIIGQIGSGMNDANAQPLLQYLVRMPIDFQVVALRQVIGRDLDMMQNDYVMRWLEYNGQEVVRRTRAA